MVCALHALLTQTIDMNAILSEILCTKQCLYILGHHRHHCQLRINTLRGQERWTHWPSVLLQGWQVELLRFFCFNIDARFL